MIGVKVFKAVRPLLFSLGVITDQNLLLMSETDAYTQVFKDSTQPYQMQLLMKDGSRFKIDPVVQCSKKLNTCLNVDDIQRFEILFP